MRRTLLVLSICALSLGLIGCNNDPSSPNATKVQRASTLLETVGFNNPVYLGIHPGAAEGKFPTFSATAIGGKSVKLQIRTTRNGGLEIQPFGLFHTVASADAFAQEAAVAVLNWKNMPSSIKPSTDGSWGEYESRQYDYEQFGKYAPSSSYSKKAEPDYTKGWPSK